MNRNDKKHDRTSITPLHALLAAAILGLMVMPLAVAGAADGPGATASAKTKGGKLGKQLNGLKARVAALETKLNGQATGDLQGVFPNLTIRNDAVTTAKIAANAVTNAKVADDAVTQAKLANNSVGAAELRDTNIRTSAAVSIPDAATGTSNSALCLGTEQLLGAGARWIGVNLGLSTLSTIPAGNGVTAVGNNQSGAARDFHADATCLAQ